MSSNRKEQSVCPRIIKLFLYNVTLKLRNMHDVFVHNFSAANHRSNRALCTTYTLLKLSHVAHSVNTQKFRSVEWHVKKIWMYSIDDFKVIKTKPWKKKCVSHEWHQSHYKTVHATLVSHTVARQSHSVRNTHETQAKITAGYISEYNKRRVLAVTTSVTVQVLIWLNEPSTPLLVQILAPGTVYLTHKHTNCISPCKA